MDAKELIAKIDFTEDTLIRAHLEQASLLSEASQYHIRKMRERMRLDSANTEAQTSTALKLRRTATEKLTEPAIKELVAGNKDVVAAKNNLDEAKAMEAWAKSLVDAYHERGSMIRSLVDLVGTSAIMESRVFEAALHNAGLEKIRQNIKKKYPGTRHE